MLMFALKNKRVRRIEGTHKVILIFALLGGSLFSQTVAPTATRTYSFINYGENYLHYSKDSSLMLNFFNKITDLKEGKRDKITIVHYGGSHIQAGTWSDKLISNFQTYGNFEGGGLYCFPYKIAVSLKIRDQLI